MKARAASHVRTPNCRLFETGHDTGGVALIDSGSRAGLQTAVRTDCGHGSVVREVRMAQCEYAPVAGPKKAYRADSSSASITVWTQRRHGEGHRPGHLPGNRRAALHTARLALVALSHRTFSYVCMPYGYRVTATRRLPSRLVLSFLTVIISIDISVSHEGRFSSVPTGCVAAANSPLAVGSEYFKRIP